MSEKLEKIGLTPRILVFSIPWCIFNQVMFGAALNLLMGASYIPTFLLLIFEAFLMNAVNKKYHFTPQEWAVFFTFLMSGFVTTPGWGSGHFRSNNAGMFRGFLSGFYTVYGAYFEAWHTRDLKLNDLLAVTEPNAVQNYLYSGPIDLSLWGPVMAWYVVHLASLYLTYHFLSIIFRKRWVDEERLDWPWQRPLYEVVKATHGMEGPIVSGTSFWNPVKNKWFWGGFIFAALTSLPDVSETLFGVNWLPGMQIAGQTWFAHRYQRVWIPIRAYIDPWWMQDFIPNQIQFTIGGAQIAAMILTPMEIIYSAIIFKFITGVVFFSINYYSGASPSRGTLEGSETGWIKWRYMFDGWGPARAGGIILGIGLLMFWKARTHIARSLKAVVSGAQREEGEPHSWRIVWLGFIGCWIIWFATMMAAGFTWTVGLSGLVGTTILYIFQSRVVAETGMGSMMGSGLHQMGWPHWCTHGPFIDLAGGMQAFPKDAAVQTMIYSELTNAQLQPGMSPSLVGFKFARELNTDTRSISIAIILATVIGVSVAVPTAIWAYHFRGQSVVGARVLALTGRSQGPSNQPIQWYDSGQPMFEFFNQPIPEMYVWNIIGIIVVFAIDFLNTRFTWFFLNPIGIIVAGRWFGSGELLWLAFPIKWLSLRFLGGKGYQEKVVPACCGLIIGYGFLYMLSALATPLFGI